MEGFYCKLLLSMVFSLPVRTLNQFSFGLCSSNGLKGIQAIKKKKDKTHLIQSFNLFLQLTPEFVKVSVGKSVLSFYFSIL